MRARSILIWCAVLVVIAVPLGAAAMSPLLAWRSPVYIVAGFAGVGAMGLMVLQPLLAGGTLPGLSPLGRRRAHRWIGGALVGAVLVHVAGLWMTSPPDVIDALLFRSPTPFSAYGVVAMGALFGAALLAVLRWRLRWRVWRLVHTTLAAVAVLGSVVHAILIEGTMETVSKAGLAVVLLVVTVKTLVELRVWAIGRGRGPM